MKTMLNKYVRTLTQYQAIAFVVVAVMYYAIVRAAVVPYLGIIIGVKFYVVGALLNLYAERLQSLRINWLLTGILGWFGYVIFSNTGLGGFLGKFCEMFSICVMGLVSAVGIFCFFAYKEQSNSVLINKIAESTFAIYLIHEHPLLRKIIWGDLLKTAESQWTSDLFPLYAAASVCGVFVVCGFIDFCRRCICTRLLKQV